MNPLKWFKRSTIIGEPYHWLSRIFSSTSSSGMAVSPDNALKVSAVCACVKVVSETLASLPLMLYERVGESGKKPAIDHPLYSLLHDAPNDFMTSFEFREVQAAHLNLRGNFYAEKLENGRSIKALIPLSPAKMDVIREGGEIKYRYTHEDGKQEVYAKDRIWHVKNMPMKSLFNGEAPEGIVGISPIAMAREAIGLSMAADNYGARYFQNNAVTGSALKFPRKLSPNAKEFLKESLNEYAKPENKFKSIVLEDGGELQSLGISNEDSQFLESRQFQIEEIARIFRVPPVLIGHPTNTMTYASAEQLFLSFATYTIRPWCVRLEQSMNWHLLKEKDRGRYFFEHVMNGLLRGDAMTRFQVYGIARQWGIYNVDEIRSLENENPLPAGKGKIYLQPMNMKEAGEKTEPKSPPVPFPPKKGNGEAVDMQGEEEEENALSE